MNNRFPRFIGLVLVILMAAGMSLTVVAQDTTTVEDAIIIGDENAESLEIVQSYLETRDPNLLAEDAQYFDSTTSAPIVGRDIISQTQDAFYGQAFSETLAVPIRYIVADDGMVVVEFEFTGVNTGEFAQQPPTGANVLIPMAGVYQVEAGQIVEARLYYDSNLLYTQLGYGYPYAPAGPPNPALYGEVWAGDLPVWVGDITEAPDSYYGEQVVVDGYVGRAVDANSFVLYQDQFLGPGHEVLVFAQTEESQDFIQLADTRVRIVGTVQQFGSDEMRAQLDREIDDATFAEYESMPVIVAESVTNVEVVQTIGHIVDNPDAFYGEEVVINGLVGDPLGTQAFALYQDQLIGIRGQVLVIDNSGQETNFAELRDTRLRVRGTVYDPALESEQFTEQTGLILNLDDPAFADYRDLPIIVAEEIVLAQ